MRNSLRKKFSNNFYKEFLKENKFDKSTENVILVCSFGYFKEIWHIPSPPSHRKFCDEY